MAGMLANLPNLLPPMLLIPTGAVSFSSWIEVVFSSFRTVTLWWNFSQTALRGASWGWLKQSTGRQDLRLKQFQRMWLMTASPPYPSLAAKSSSTRLSVSSLSFPSWRQFLLLYRTFSLAAKWRESTSYLSTPVRTQNYTISIRFKGEASFFCPCSTRRPFQMFWRNQSICRQSTTLKISYRSPALPASSSPPYRALKTRTVQCSLRWERSTCVEDGGKTAKYLESMARYARESQSYRVSVRMARSEYGSLGKFQSSFSSSLSFIFRRKDIGNAVNIMNCKQREIDYKLE